MAERRMFAKTIIDSDTFLDMPMTSQCLYFHLSMRADDEGFINNPKRIMRMIGASEDDIKLLMAKNYIITFDTGVIVIKHWRLHNYIQKDRFKETVYQEEKALLSTKENGVYSLDTECIQNGYSLDTQVSIGKSNIELNKPSIEKNKAKERKVPVVYFPDEPQLEEAFQAFIQMRKKIKAPMTDRAIELAINKLEELANNDTDIMVKIVDQSTMNSWKSFYPLKEGKETKEEKKISIVDEWMNA